MKQTRYIYLLTMVLGMALLASCRDPWVEKELPKAENDYTGEMILFRSGTTDNSIITRADADTYYMPNTYRFVCRMFYKAQTGSEKFDVSGQTDQTAWMKVDGDLGNSLYWNMSYEDVQKNSEGKYIEGPGGVDNYGNDYSAHAFYWQNRQEHAFLAWTDLNKATNMVGGNSEGQLKFEKDLNYRVYSNEMVQAWDLDYYEIYGIAEKFANQEEMEAYVREHGKESTFTNAQTELETEKQWTWQPEYYYYRHGKQYKWSRQHVNVENEVTGVSYDIRWYQEFMYFKTIPFEPDGTEIPENSSEDGKENIVAYLKKNGVRVAKAELQVNSDGEPVDAEGNVISDPNDYIYTYAQTDTYGNLMYDENQPEFTFYFGEHRILKERKKYDDYPCNRFDLTRGTKDNMSEQPDIAQALTLQAPSGATQEANRVNLYFKHQFSQIQVNVKNSGDNSVVLTASDIQKVELLGVTEEGYVFTELNENGEVHSAAYKEIDFSKYTEQELKDNPYGTAFEMFVMSEAATGYLKSFNCLTFGQLQAIRITWQENGEGNIIHASTFRIPNTELVNLKSGMRYIWNIEVRRGTLAIIRTEIIDWEMPTEEVYNGSTDGTIHN